MPGGADAVGHLHADRCRQLRRRLEAVSIDVAQGDAGDHLDGAGRHHLRHGARRDAAERDDDRARHVRLQSAAGTVLGAGTQTLSVTFTPTDAANYTGASKSVAIKVAQATPVITWRAPADIIYGTALSATQLNATTTVPGTFVYDPPPGRC